MPTALPSTPRRYADHMRACADFDGLRALPVPASGAAVRDGAGHIRAAYPGLFAATLAQLGADVTALTKSLAAPRAWPTTTPGGADAQPLTASAWDALAAARVRSDPEMAREMFTRIAGQGARFLDDGSNPEPRWYAELVLLHALTSYAAWAGAADLLEAAAGAAAYHQAETQPDHATGQPWAVHAALLRPHTLPLADLLLLPVSMPDGRSVVNRLLLADAVLAVESPAFVAASTW